MASINFRTDNGQQLSKLLKLGDVPIHVPTPRKVGKGDEVELTYGNYAKPTSIGFVVVIHEHK